MEKTKKKFQAPHTFVILVGLIIIASLATYIVPAGEFTRYVDEATGRTIVEAGSYVQIESNPISLLAVPGLVYRALILVVLLAIDTAYIIWYEKRVKKHPEKSILVGEDIGSEFVFDDDNGSMSPAQAAVLAIMGGGFALLIWGLGKKGWYFEEMSALFLVMGILAGAVNGFGPNKIAKLFGQGARGITVGALAIGY